MLGFVVLKKMNLFGIQILHNMIWMTSQYPMIVYWRKTLCTMGLCIGEKQCVLCHQFQRGIDYSVVIRRIRSHFVKLTASKRFIINMYTHSHLLGDPPLHTDIQRE